MPAKEPVLALNSRQHYRDSKNDQRSGSPGTFLIGHSALINDKDNHKKNPYRNFLHKYMNTQLLFIEKGFIQSLFQEQRFSLSNLKIFQTNYL